MPRNGAVGLVYAASLRVVAITAMVLLVFRATPAHADAVDELIKQLENSSDKIRLSAALNLAKLGDPKAILPLAKSLGNDSDKNVRAAAAVGLGKLVDGSTGKSVKNLAINALKKAASGDASEFVKQQAEKSLTALGVGGLRARARAGPERDGRRDLREHRPDVVEDRQQDRRPQVPGPDGQGLDQSTLGRVASRWRPPGRAGRADQGPAHPEGIPGVLRRRHPQHADVNTNGGIVAIVSCKVSMLLASFPDKSVFGFLNGGAKVKRSASARDIALAGEDCVTAVIEDLIAKKIVPTIKAKAGIP